MTLSLSAILIWLQGLYFKKFRLRRFMKEASCTFRITVSAILICFQVSRPIFQKTSPSVVWEGNKLHTYNDCECHFHMFTRHIFQKNCLRRFKKEGSFTRRMTLSAILICLHFTRHIFKNFHLRQFKKETNCTLIHYNDCECHSHMFTMSNFQKKLPPAV